MIRNIFIVLAVCAMLAESSALMTNRSRRSLDTCGVATGISERIVYGQDFPRGSFPWIVALMHTGTSPPQFFCGGTLISKTFVISAAHCILRKHATEKFLPRDIIALFGAHDFSNSFEAGRIMQSPKKIFIHDDWNHLTSSYDADMSLLEFWSNKIHFDEYIQPICLWSSPVEPTVMEGLVTGWGRSEDRTKIHENKPKMITVTIQSNELCFLGTKALVDLSSIRTFCAGLRNGSGVCNGDSGGGLFINVDDLYYLKGIVSSSLIKEGGCDVSKNAVYTNVEKFRDWIKEKTGDPLVSSTTQAVATSTRHSILTEALEDVFCTSIKMVRSVNIGNVNTCFVNQTIHTENYVIGQGIDATVGQFDISKNREVKFLPRLIGENFPNLKELGGYGCGLTVIRDYYFKDMGNLKRLHLYDNKVVSIESKAFRDLISVRGLAIHQNMIETLDEKLFVAMVDLENLWLSDNKIKFLSPTTFKIPGGKLEYVNLYENVCINESYVRLLNSINKLESDLRTNCSKKHSVTPDPNI